MTKEYIFLLIVTNLITFLITKGFYIDKGVKALQVAFDCFAYGLYGEELTVENREKIVKLYFKGKDIVVTKVLK